MSKVANFTFDALEKHLCHLLYVLNNLLIDPKWHCISATNIIKRHDKSIIVMMSTSTTNGCVPARHFSDESWLDCCVTAGISLITVTMSLVDQWRRYVEVCEFFKYGPHRYETFFYRTSAPMRTVIIGMVLSVCLSHCGMISTTEDLRSGGFQQTVLLQRVFGDVRMLQKFKRYHPSETIVFRYPHSVIRNAQETV